MFSVGSDGTDGPTDAAGGFVTGQTRDALAGQGVRIFDVLKDNDAYHALEACGGLLRTGAKARVRVPRRWPARSWMMR